MNIPKSKFTLWYALSAGAIALGAAGMAAVHSPLPSKYALMPEASSLKAKSTETAEDSLKQYAPVKLPSTRVAAQEGEYPAVDIINSLPTITPAPETNLVANVIYGQFDPCGGDEKFVTRGFAKVPIGGTGKFEYLLTDCLANGNGVDVNGTYWWTSVDTMNGTCTLYSNDTQTWEQLSEQNVGMRTAAEALAWDPTTGKVFGCFPDEYGEDHDFGTMDYSNFTFTEIKKGRTYQGLAVNAQGVLYAIDGEGNLLIVDKTTGEETVIGNTGMPSGYLGSMAFDRATGKLYWAYCGEAPKIGTVTQYGGTIGALLQIDTETATPYLVTRFARNEELLGMFSPGKYWDDNAPGEITDGSFTYETDHSGTLTFTLPTVLASGASQAGAMFWKVTLDGKTVNEGFDRAGQVITCPVDMTEDGVHTITAVASNDNGEGPKFYQRLYSGYDDPFCHKPEIRREGDNLILSWDDITMSHGGFVDPDKVTYLLRCDQTSAYLVKREKVNEYVFPIPEDTAGAVLYTFTLYGYYDGFPCMNTQTSEPYYVGTISLPFNPDFKNNIERRNFHIIDANHDMMSWEYDYWNKEMEAQTSSATDNDDWLVYPPAMMEAGKVYKAWIETDEYESNDPAVVEGYAATSNQLADMGAPIGRIELAPGKNRYEFEICPLADGPVFFTLRNVSKCGAPFIHLLATGIEVGCDENAPKAPSDLSINRTLREATLKCTAPALSILGQPLAETPLTAKIDRNGVTIKTIENITPGQEFQTTDFAEQAGNYNYRVSFANEYGYGHYSMAKTYLGYNITAAPTGVELTENGNSGAVTLSWLPVTQDIEGMSLGNEDIFYRIEKSTPQGYLPVADQIRNTSYSFNFNDGSTQEMALMRVIPVTESGDSQTPGYSDMIPVGKPMALPYSESFADGKCPEVSGMVGISGTGGAWSPCDDSRFSDLQSYDHDNGFLMLRADYAGTKCGVFFGKIDLTGLVNPALTLYAFQLASDDSNVLSIEMREPGQEWQPLRTISLGELPEVGWNKVICPAGAFAGKCVQYRLVGEINHYAVMGIDNITFEEHYNSNLTAKSLHATDAVEPGQRLQATFMVENTGSLDMAKGDWHVEFELNGRKVSEAAGKSVSFGQTAIFTLRHEIERTEPEQSILTAHIVTDKDDFDNDNHLQHAFTVIYPTTVPTGDLSATTDGEGNVNLVWEAPDLSAAAPEAVTEDFENVPAWTYKSFDDWTLIDADKSTIGGINGIDFPQIPDLGQGSCGFFILDSDYEFGNLSEWFVSHSGHHLLTQFYNMAGKCDDWIISPVLYGGAQTISVWAKAISGSYPESFEILASDGSKTLSDFTAVAKYTVESEEWTQYSALIPAGSKRFAIRCTSKGAYMLMLDDITYIPEGEAREMKILGYNVYRNNKKLNDTPLTDCAYTATGHQPGDSYFVTAVYENGESRGSNIVTPQGAGVNQAATLSVSVTTEAKHIVITGAEGRTAEIFTTAGIKVAVLSNCGQREEIETTSGIYIVRIGSQIWKIEI